jgi:hypothetical protein
VRAAVAVLRDEPQTDEVCSKSNGPGSDHQMTRGLAAKHRPPNDLDQNAETQYDLKYAAHSRCGPLCASRPARSVQRDAVHSGIGQHIERVGQQRGGLRDPSNDDLGDEHHAVNRQ